MAGQFTGSSKRVEAHPKSSNLVVNSVSLSRDLPVFTGFFEIIRVVTNKGIDAGWLDKKGQEGIAFWSAMYIPIVVAMSSIQDVVAALSGGTIAVLGGVLGVALGFVFIPILRKFGA